MGLRHLGQRRALVHLRGADGAGLLPARAVRGRAEVHAAVAHLRRPVPHGQPADQVRQRCLSAQPADQPLLRHLRPGGGVHARPVRIPLPRRRSDARAARAARHHGAGATRPGALREQADSVVHRRHGADHRGRVNGRKWKQFDRATVFLPYDKTPDVGEGADRPWGCQADGRASVLASPNIFGDAR